MSATAKDIDGLTDAVLSCTGVVGQIVEHMARSPDRPAPERLPEILHRLLSEALTPLAAGATRTELRAATRLMSAAAGLIADEISLVPHPPPPRAGGRRRRGCHGL